MAIPTTRELFKEHCLRRLGAPVIDINVDNDQIEDRIDEALQYYRDYHFDGAEHVLMKHVVTQEDMDNKYITIPEQVMGIINIFPMGSGTNSSGSFFNLNYQLHLNDLFDLRSTNIWGSNIVNYYMAMQYISLIEEMFVGEVPIRYNRHVNKLHIDMDWNARTSVGQYIIIECYYTVDPDTYSDVWSDRWLQRYATALIKRQWGAHLIKFEGMQLPGGVTFNGQKLYDDAIEEINKLEEEMIISYSLPVVDMLN